MTDDTTNDDAELAAAELDDLKDRAAAAGLKFHPNIGYENLSAKYQEFMEAKEVASAPPAPAPVVAETAGQTRNRVKLKQTALVHIRVSCMNPNKKEWEGEVFTVSNAAVGTLKKYVPFDADWHVPYMIYTMIKERECQIFRTVKDSRGNASRTGKLIKEFGVEVLPDMTPAELKALAQRQAMASGTAAA